MSLWNSVKNYLPAVAGVTAAALTGGAAAPLIAGAGLGLSSAMVNKDAQLKSEQRQYEYTKQLNAEMNAYNTPEAQMERYIKAGMNPYMASVSSGTQGSAGAVSTSSTNPGAGFDRAVAIANAQADLKAKALAIEKQGIENSYLPAQIESTIAETVNKSALLKNQALTAERDLALLNYLGANTISSKDNWLTRVGGVITSKLSGNSGDFNSFLDFYHKNGYYPSRAELSAGTNRAYFKGVRR